MAASVDFLKFNAYDMKALITRKLSEDTNYTDQVYEGSNLAILIDIVAYLYQGLVYNLNNAASESMFADTQLYENMARLVKFVGYSPRGCKTATAQFVTQIEKDYQNKCVMPYAALDTGVTDSAGNRIYYSLVEPLYLNSAGTYETTLYNGRWRLYNTVFVASGTEYETFVLDLHSDSDHGQYVAWPYIHVYVKRYNPATAGYDYYRFDPVDDGLLLNQNNKVEMYNANSKVFGVSLDDQKRYEIKFGNGYYGEMLKDGDQVIVMYLLSNGPDGEIPLGGVTDKSFQHTASLFGVSQELYEKIFADYRDSSLSQMDLQSVKFKNVDNSTAFVPEETVPQIRQSAPFFNRTNNRLLTQSDFEYYVKNNYSNFVLDVKAMNNWDYTASFYRWLYQMGLNEHGSGDYYLNENTLLKYDYKYSDACDSNNVYLWVKFRNGIQNVDGYFKILDKELYKIKVLTSELTFLRPIDVQFDIFAGTKEQYKDVLKGFAENNTYIEITTATNLVYASDTIKQMAYDRIIDFFSEGKFTLGSEVNFSGLVQDIFNIPGVENVRTVMKDDDQSIYRI